MILCNKENFIRLKTVIRLKFQGIKISENKVLSKKTNVDKFFVKYEPNQIHIEPMLPVLAIRNKVYRISKRRSQNVAFLLGSFE